MIARKNNVGSLSIFSSVFFEMCMSIRSNIIITLTVHFDETLADAYPKGKTLDPREELSSTFRKVEHAPCP